MDWTAEKAREARNTLERWMEWTINFEPTQEEAFVPNEAFLDALSDDLNTHLALVCLRALHGSPQVLLDHARWLGFLSDESRRNYRHLREGVGRGLGSGQTAHTARLAMTLDNLRNEALMSKDFSRVDQLKAALLDAGLEVRISRDGVELIPGPDFDPAKLEALK
ncbi:MAG: hypothetical protein IBX58_01845 [Roseovarius sp.]|nr:hypothetical protein [Roseovarius sp.]